MEPSDIPDRNATYLYVGNLDRRVTDTMMLNILKTGLPHIKEKVIAAQMYPNDMHSPEGYCFIQFSDNNSASQALTFLNGRDFLDKKVKVSWASNSTQPNGMPKLLSASVSIYVGNIDDDMTENDLKAAFEVFGEIVNVKVVRDPITNMSKNIAFISFSNKPDAEKAIHEMHGAMLRTRPIKTNWASRNQNVRKEELDYDEVFKSGDGDTKTVYVGGVPSNCTEEDLKKHFKDHKAENYKDNGVRVFASKNYAFMKFETHADATTAIVNTNGTELLGSCLKCWWGKDENMTPGAQKNYVRRQYQQPQPFGGQQQQHQNNMQQQQSMQNMTPQQQQQYMQAYMQTPYYQQQYYQYYMQQYQQMQQQQQQGGQQQGGHQGYQGNQQQQQQGGGYNNSSNYQGGYNQSYQN